MIRPERTIEKLKSGSPVVIVALGDSLTYGWMVSKGYIDYLKHMLNNKYPGNGLRIINRGIPGDTAQGGVHRLQGDVIRHKPDCVFIQFGLNDAFVGYSPENYNDNINLIIQGIRESTDSEIILISSVCLDGERENVFIGRFYKQLEDLAELYRLPIARVHRYWKKKISEGVDFNSLVQFDGVHPNTRGYKLMAEAIMEIL